MPPKLVLCFCDPQWTALAVCPDCEQAQLEHVLRRKGVLEETAPIVAQAYRVLAKSYLDALDEIDRETDRASEMADFWRDGTHQ